jgi:YhcH/YjgK/YiaL family protein
MIIDVLDNADRYLGFNKGFRRAFAFLMRDDLMKIEPGRHEIDGDRVFAIVEDAQGRDKKDAQLEAHEKYIDIQLVVDGTDKMGWRLKSACSEVSVPYDEKADIQFFKDEPDVWLPVTPGMFVIFLPGDAHMPLISDGRLRKVIMKVAVDQ